MKFKLKRGLIYSLILTMAVPVSLVMGLLTANHAFAAAGASGGDSGSGIASNNGKYVTLNPLQITTSADGDFTSAGGIALTLTNTNLVGLTFGISAGSVTAQPTANLDLGLGNGVPVSSSISLTPTAITIHLTTPSSHSGDSVLVSGLQVRATVGGTVGFQGIEHVLVNSIAAGGNINVDAQSAVISKAETLDANKNGRIDGLKVTFSDKIDDSTLLASDFSVVGGGTISAVTTGLVANDEVAIVGLNEGAISDTNIKPTIKYTPGNLVDLLGNQVAISTAMSIDTAPPAMVWARTVDVTHVKVGFSEDLNGSSVNSSGNEFAISLPNHTVNHASETSGVVTLTLTDPITDNNEKPSIVFAGDVQDLALVPNHVLAAGPIIAEDGISNGTSVDPNVVGVKFVEGRGINNEQLTVSFSDQILTVGSLSDYLVEYDQTASFSGGQRIVSIIGSPVLSSSDQTKVILTIADQSGMSDQGGVFRLTVINIANVTDLSGSPVDSSHNIAVSDPVLVFDTAPTADFSPIVTKNPTPTLTGTVDDPGATVLITINGIVYIATNNGDGSWTLPSAVFTSPLSDGAYDVILVATDTAHISGATTTYHSGLTVDTTAPVLKSVSISSSNSDHTKAAIGDTIKLSFVSSESITPVVSINSLSASVTSSGNTYIASRIMGANDKIGTVTFAITFADLTGNNGTTVMSTTDGTSVVLQSATTSNSAVSQSTPVATPSFVQSAQAASPTTVTTAPASSAATTPDQPKTDTQGQIKGDENTADNSVNWTPWIILFSLIILAGAATGGYFYWFSGKEELATSTGSVPQKKENNVAKVTVKEKNNLDKPNNKKSKRW